MMEVKIPKRGKLNGSMCIENLILVDMSSNKRRTVKIQE